MTHKDSPPDYTPWIKDSNENKSNVLPRIIYTGQREIAGWDGTVYSFPIYRRETKATHKPQEG